MQNISKISEIYYTRVYRLKIANLFKLTYHVKYIVACSFPFRNRTGTGKWVRVYGYRLCTRWVGYGCDGKRYSNHNWGRITPKR